MLSKVAKRLVFYVDTECSFSSESRCSFYSSKQVQKLAGKNARQVWGSKCCPIVYVKTGRKKFNAFCPTRGGAWGEQLPSLGGPSATAVRVEVQSSEDETWPELVEKAAKTACEAKCP